MFQSICFFSTFLVLTFLTVIHADLLTTCIFCHRTLISHIKISQPFALIQPKGRFLGMITETSGKNMWASCLWLCSTVIIVVLLIFWLCSCFKIFTKMLGWIKSKREEVRSLGWLLYDSILTSTADYFVCKNSTVVIEIIPRISVHCLTVHWCFGTLSTV